MYIYFDTNGTIKEVINDESIRRGSSDYNKIYCYLEGNPDIDDIWYLQKNPDGTLTNEVSFVDNVVTKAIPYDAKRDMKYFQDFEEYQFYVFTLSSSYLSQNGLVVATIRVAENNTLWALGELTFNVQANIVNSDNDITQSQYDYLLLAYASRTLNEQTGSDLDNLLDEKIEAKISCLGTPDIFDTTANIEALTSNGGIAIATDTGYIWIWDSENEEYVNTNYKYLADVSIYYTKTEINNYKKMWDNLVYCCEFTIDDSAKTMTISGNWAFTKYSFVVIDNIAVKTISYANLSLGNYCLVIRNNALEFVNFANAIQDGDMVLWIGFLDGTGDIRTDIYRCNNKVTNLALYCSDNIKIDTTNKNFVIPSAYLFWNSGYASISAQNISYASYLNATCVLAYRNGVFKVLGLQNIELFYNDVIVAVVWFRSDGFPMSKIYVVNEAPDKAFTELPLSSKIFMRVGVIGDSYTSGWIKDNVHKNNPNYCWVKYMKQLTGNEWTNFGVSGSSTKSWIDGTLGQLPQVQSKGNKCQAYVIGLMINDQNQGMQTYVPLGTSSDIGTNANSYYAYYYKLINALLSVNSSAIIFCNTCPRTDGDFPSYNQAVIDVVNYCQSESKNVYLVELRNYYWRNETFNNDALNGHYTAIGYEYMAEIFNKAFSDTINANASSLKEVNLIPYDSATVYDYVYQKINDLRWELGSHTLDVESDTDVAFSKSVPNYTIGCQINSAGGMSYKSENLFNKSTANIGKALSITNGALYDSSNDMVSDYIEVIPNTQYSNNVPTVQFNICYYNENKTFISGETKVTPYTIPTNARYLRIQALQNRLDTFMIVSGTTAPSEYKEYFDGIRDSAVTSVVSKDSNNTTIDTLEIPSEIQALTGYGWGINDTCYNYIDFERKVFVQKVGTRAYQSGDESDTSVITDGTTTYYQLSSVVETDISAYLTTDTIDVEGGGSIEFTNTYSQDVPSDIDYLIEEVKA